MQTKTAFSSKRFLLALMLCACSIILLQNDDVAANTSFTSQLISVFAGLAVCFVLFLPAIYIKTHFNQDVVSLASEGGPKLKIPLMTVYACYFVYTALYFLLPYTEMFHTKYFPEVSPCLITVLLLVCCVYAALKGVNVISRFGVFLFVFAMVTNFLMFGGSISELDWAHCTFALSGGLGDFWQNVVYFVTPAFVIPIFACLSDGTRNFRLRQPVFALLFTGLKYFHLFCTGRLCPPTGISDLFALACGAFCVLCRYREFLSRLEHDVGVHDCLASFVQYHTQCGGKLPHQGNSAFCRSDSGRRCGCSGE